VRLISLLSVAILTLIFVSVLSIAIPGSLHRVYAVEKINTINVTPRAIHVTLPGGQTATVFHLFVVYNQKIDKQYVCQGFPFDPATGQIPKDSDLPLNLPSPFVLQGRCIPFESDNRDWPFRNSPSTTVISGADSKDVYKCFVKVTNTLNEAKIPYALLATNSNSYARAILDKCEVPGGDSRLPPGIVRQLVPGWQFTVLP
jgi:hypothetical protein